MNEKRRAEAEANYRAKFEALNLEGFEFLRREWSRERDRRFWVRCQKCGAEFLREKYVLCGKVKSIQCRNCGNGTAYSTPFVDEVLEFYSEKHTYNETCERFGINRGQLATWAKARGVTNGRTKSEIQSEKAKAGADKAIKEAENRISIELLDNGFGYISGYKRKGSIIRVRHLICGTEFERRSDYFRKYGYNCPVCKENERIKAREEAERLRREQKENAKREAELFRELKRAEKQKEHDQRLNALHICKICGKPYSIRDYMKSTGMAYERDSGFCSKECNIEALRIRRRIEKKLRPNDNHRARARRFGCEYEKGITLKKLIARDGLTCALCGKQCDPNDHTWTKYCGPLYPSIDHIIPMSKGGGHTWNNIQIAHIICNSRKETSLLV